MSDLTLMLFLPLTLAGGLVWLRGLRPMIWWLSLCGLLATVAIVVVSGRPAEWRQAVGGFVVYAVPILFMFVGLRPDVFRRKRWLIPPVGLLLFLLGLAGSLSINVSAKLIQP